jgi:hypothetical protein
MEGKRMQKWSQSIPEQWKNVERVMEEEREWKEKNKGDGLEFRGGVYDGGKVGGTRGWLGRALWGVGRQCGVRLF